MYLASAVAKLVLLAQPHPRSRCCCDGRVPELELPPAGGAPPPRGEAPPGTVTQRSGDRGQSVGLCCNIFNFNRFHIYFGHLIFYLCIFIILFFIDSVIYLGRILIWVFGY